MPASIRIGCSGWQYRDWRSRYDRDTLQAWADRLLAWRDDGPSSWVYFNNDIGGEAPRDAIRMRDLVNR